VNVNASEECDAIFPFQFPTVLTAHLQDGTSMTEKVLVNRGGPQNPLTDDELALKFESNVRASLNQDKAREVAHTIFDFATNKTSLADLASLLERV
jgi:2-methylcitrate dehydratase PrpD